MRSVWSFGMEGDDGSRGVYWIRTFRFPFHKGRVLCVTLQVSDSHGMDGSWKSAGALAGEKVGGRRISDAIIVEDAVTNGRDEGVCYIVGGVVVKQSRPSRDGSLASSLR